MTRRMMTLVAILHLGVAMPAIQADDYTAKKGETITGSLKTGQTDTYRLDLNANQFVTGLADQMTVDVVIKVKNAKGEEIGSFDGPGRGAERFQFTAEAAGIYVIEVSPFKEEEGDYSFSLGRVEPVAKKPAARVDQLMAAYDNTETPGAVYAFIRDGKIVHSDAWGMANLTHGIPFSTATISNIGSVSKQFMGFAIASLEAQGKLSLDDDIRKFIPDLKDFGETITLRNLLTHTSGYREFLNTLAIAGRQGVDHINRDEMIGIIQRQPELQNKPGAEWNYNNTGYGLLTIVVEEVTGESFEKWMKANVFDPLGMKDTHVKKDRFQIIPGSAQGYTYGEGGVWANTADLGGAMGAGGIHTTVADLAKWIDNLESGAHGGKAVIEAMVTPFELNDGESTKYGLGLFMDEFGGQKRVQHGGADMAHRAQLNWYPDLDAAIVTMSNNANFAGGIVGDITRAWLGEQMETGDKQEEDEKSLAGEGFDPEKFDAASFDAMAGQYELEIQPGFIMTFTAEEGKFYTQATGQPKLEMVPVAPEKFRLLAVDAQVSFHKDDEGTYSTITLHQGGNHKANRLKEEPWKPSEEEMTSYTGRYFSEELETSYSVSIEDGKLKLKHRRTEAKDLTPVMRDKFSSGFPIANVDFIRGDDGSIVAFTAANGRARDIRFDKVD